MRMRLLAKTDAPQHHRRSANGSPSLAERGILPRLGRERQCPAAGGV